MTGVVLVAVVAAVVAFVVAGRSEEFSVGRRLLAAAAGGAVTVAAGMMLWHYHCEVWQSVRTMVPYAVAKGLEIYYPAQQGPAWGNIYPPVGFWLYTPVVWGATAGGAVYIGQALSMLLISGAIYAVAWGLTGAHSGGLLALGVWYAAAGVIQPLSDVTYYVHVDPPALAFVLGACGLLTVENPRWRTRAVLLAGVLAALAVGSKQTMLPSVLVLAGWVWWRRRHEPGGWTAPLPFLGAFAATGVVIAAAALASFSAAGMFHVMFKIPTSQPMDFGRVYSLGPFVPRLLAWVPGPIVAAVLLARAARCREAVPILLAGAAELPPALAARFKVGGDENNLAFFLFFFVVAGAISLHRLLRNLSPGARAKWVTGVLVLMTAAGVHSALKYREYPSWSGRPATDPHAASYELLKERPGRYYFQWLPLSHYMAEGRLVHQSWGITDRAFAGEKILPGWFDAYIPTSAVLLCSVQSPVTGDSIYLILRDRFSVKVNVPELPGWYCYYRPGGVAGDGRTGGGAVRPATSEPARRPGE